LIYFFFFSTYTFISPEIKRAFGSSVIKVSLEDAVNGAELIFEGRVVSKDIRLSPVNNRPFTYFTFEIIDIIKGSYAQSSIELGYMGGSNGTYTLKVTDMHMPEVGEKGIYFVESLDTQQVHPLFGWQQGHYRVVTDQQTGNEVVEPMEMEKESSNARSMVMQRGTDLETFKSKIRELERLDQ